MATYTINIEEQGPVNRLVIPVNNTTTNVAFNLLIREVDNNLATARSTINWGDGTIETVTSSAFEHNYSSQYQGDIIIDYESTPDKIESFSDHRGSRRINVSNLDLDYFSTLIGLKIIDINYSAVVGNLSSLSNLTSLETLTLMTSSVSVTGDINSLSSSVTSLIIYGTNTVTGDISNTLNNLQTLDLRGNNTINGILDNKLSLVLCIIEGSNTISGLIDNVSSTVTRLELRGNNTIAGSYENNTLSNATSVQIFGNNTISGVVDNAFMADSVTIHGNNTISGNISNTTLPSNSLNIDGNNTIGGSINNTNIPRTFVIRGNNVISGEFTSVILAPLPNPTAGPLINFNVTGNHTITVNLNNLENPANILLSTNTNSGFFGDLGLIDNTTQGTTNVPIIPTIIAGAVSSNLSYTTKDWTSNPNLNIEISLGIVDDPSFALSPAELDQLLIDLDNATFRKGGTNASRLTLTGGFSRTSASDAAFNQLVADGMQITIN